MKFIFYTVLLLSFIGGSVASGQENGGAKGRVCTAQDGSISEVAVSILQAGKEVHSTTTNLKGEFLVKGLKSGRYDFVFRKSGFNAGTLKNVELGNKKIRDLGNHLVLDVDDGNLVIIKGIVFDEEGRSIPGAEILIERVLSGETYQKLTTTVTSTGGDAIDRGEFTVKLPDGAAKYRVTATFKAKTASKEIVVDAAAVYRTAITLNLQREEE